METHLLLHDDHREDIHDDPGTDVEIDLPQCRFSIIRRRNRNFVIIKCTKEEEEDERRT
jgi:hypothetical protein